MDDAELKQLAQNIVAQARARSTSGPWNLDRYDGLASLHQQLGEAIQEHEDLVALLHNPEAGVDAKKLGATAYIKRLIVATDGLAGMLANAGTQAKEVYNQVVAGNLSKVGRSMLPSVDYTFEDLKILRDTWGENIKFSLPCTITVTMKPVSVLKFEKLRHTWPSIVITMDFTRANHDVFRFSVPGFGPRTHPITIGDDQHGHSDKQPHPHILSSGKLCTAGTSSEGCSYAYRDARVIDLLQVAKSLMEEPYESKDHTADILCMPGAECLCDECGKWSTFSKTDGLVGYIAGGFGVKDITYTCKGCLPTCPLTGNLLKADNSWVYKGTKYHIGTKKTYEGKDYIASEGSDHDGVWVPDEALLTCVITGKRGVAVEVPAAGQGRTVRVSSYQTLIKLLNGKAVVAGCLDLVTESGDIIGELNGTFSTAVWWRGRIENAWAAGRSWHARAAAAGQDRGAGEASRASGG